MGAQRVRKSQAEFGNKTRNLSQDGHAIRALQGKSRRRRFLHQRPPQTPEGGAKTRGAPHRAPPRGEEERKPPQAENPKQGTRPRKARGPEAPRAAPPDQGRATRRPPPPRREGAPQATPTQEERRTQEGEENKIETGKNPLYQYIGLGKGQSRLGQYRTALITRE